MTFDTEEVGTNHTAGLFRVILQPDCNFNTVITKPEHRDAGDLRLSSRIFTGTFMKQY